MLKQREAFLFLKLRMIQNSFHIVQDCNEFQYNRRWFDPFALMSQETRPILHSKPIIPWKAVDQDSNRWLDPVSNLQWIDKAGDKKVLIRKYNVSIS